MFVCVCEAVTAQEIDQQIENGAKTVREISGKTGAGTNCGKCVAKIRHRITKIQRDKNSIIAIQTA